MTQIDNERPHRRQRFAALRARSTAFRHALNAVSEAASRNETPFPPNLDDIVAIVEERLDIDHDVAEACGDGLVARAAREALDFVRARNLNADIEIDREDFQLGLEHIDTERAFRYAYDPSFGLDVDAFSRFWDIGMGAVWSFQAATLRKL